MKKTLFIVGLATATLLSSCGMPKVTPEEYVKKVDETYAAITSYDYDVLKISGSIKSDSDELKPGDNAYAYVTWDGKEPEFSFPKEAQYDLFMVMFMSMSEEILEEAVLSPEAARRYVNDESKFFDEANFYISDSAFKCEFSAKSTKSDSRVKMCGEHNKELLLTSYYAEAKMDGGKSVFDFHFEWKVKNA